MIRFRAYALFSSVLSVYAALTAVVIGAMSGDALAWDNVDPCVRESVLDASVVQTCKNMLAANKCDDFVKKNPIFKDDEIKCEPATLLDDVKSAGMGGGGCLEGILPIQLTEALFKAARKNAEIRQEFLAAADEDPSLKRSLVAGDPRYAGLTPVQLDAQLSSISAATLLSQEQMIQQNEADMQSDLRGQQSIYSERDSSNSKKPKVLSSEPLYRLLYGLIRKKLSKQYESFECLNSEIQGEMICEDASTALGLALPMATGSKVLLAFLEATSGVNADHVAELMPGEVEEMIDETAVGVGLISNFGQQATRMNRIRSLSNPHVTLPQGGNDRKNQLQADVAELHDRLDQSDVLLRLKTQQLYDLLKKDHSGASYAQLKSQLIQQVQLTQEYKNYVAISKEYATALQQVSQFNRN